MKPRMHVYAHAGKLVTHISERIMAAASQRIQQHGAFHLVLAGGSTPRAIYERLATMDAEWSAWHIYFGDERYLPRGDAGRNETMVNITLLDHVSIPCEQVHPMATGGSLEQAARDYTRLLANVPRFDLVLLGLGEDGHTASLFPGHDMGDDSEAADILIVTDAPKPPPDRLSISANKLGQSEQVFFIVTGENKHEPMTRWLDEGSVPAASINTTNGIDIFLDTLAAPR